MCKVWALQLNSDCQSHIKKLNGFEVIDINILIHDIYQLKHQRLTLISCSYDEIQTHGVQYIEEDDEIMIEHTMIISVYMFIHQH